MTRNRIHPSATRPAEAPAPGETTPSLPAEAAAPENRQTPPTPASESCRDMSRHVRETEPGEKHDDRALDELRQKTVRRLTRLIQEEDNVERLAKLLKILCDIRQSEAPAPQTAPTLIEKLQNISRQQQNQTPL